jgi:negative regulator of flagellin synthesis FlgM
MSYPSGIGDLKQAMTSIAPATTTETQQVSGAKAKESNKTALPRESQSDEARLSSTGGLIAQALESSDVRTAKVEALQKAISDGSYNVSSANVADKMIRSLLD